MHQDCKERVCELKVNIVIARPCKYMPKYQKPTIAMIATKPVALPSIPTKLREGKAGHISNDDWIMIV